MGRTARPYPIMLGLGCREGEGAGALLGRAFLTGRDTRQGCHDAVSLLFAGGNQRKPLPAAWDLEDHIAQG